MSKHTPGPWAMRTRAIQDGTGGGNAAIIYTSAKHIMSKAVDGPLSDEAQEGREVQFLGDLGRDSPHRLQLLGPGQ